MGAIIFTDFFLKLGLIFVNYQNVNHDYNQTKRNFTKSLLSFYINPAAQWRHAVNWRGAEPMVHHCTFLKVEPRPTMVTLKSIFFQYTPPRAKPSIPP